MSLFLDRITVRKSKIWFVKKLVFIWGQPRPITQEGRQGLADVRKTPDNTKFGAIKIKFFCFLPVVVAEFVCQLCHKELYTKQTLHTVFC